MFKKKNKMELRNIKKKRIKLLGLLLIMYISFAFSYYYTINNKFKNSNKDFINFILNGGNINNLNNIKLTNIVNKTINYLFKIDFQNPSTLLNLSGINSKQKNIDIVHNDDYSNLETLKEISSYISDPYQVDTSNPIIYLYNSHQLENYNNDNLEIYGITPNVLMASYIFKEKLNKNGISTIVEDTNLTELLTINKWDYSYSYKASRLLILEKKNKYQSLKYYIDIHRDSVTKDISTTNINNKDYARILFVIGLENNNYEKNLSLAQNLNDLINKYYPKLSRGIYKKEGEKVDGIYNQDISPNSMLIEIGGNQNNINEVFNTIEALTDILKMYINGDKK